VAGKVRKMKVELQIGQTLPVGHRELFDRQTSVSQSDYRYHQLGEKMNINKCHTIPSKPHLISETLHRIAQGA
jgi:hypothetical protein